MAVKEAQVAVPAQRNDIDDQNPVVQRHKLKVDRLNERPNHPILLQRSKIRAVQLILRARTLHNRHTAQENEEVGASEDSLVGSDAGEDLEVLVLEHDSVLQEFEPGRCCGAEDSCRGFQLALRIGFGRGEERRTSTVQCHSSSPGQLVVLETLLFNELLGHSIAGREEDCGGDALGEQWARGQLSLVPA